MENLREIIMAVCVLSAGTSIIEGLVAGTKLKKQVSFLLNLIFVTVISAPILKGTLNLELPELKSYDIADVADTESSYTEELKRQMNENISEVLIQQLEAAGIKCSSIEISVNISETNSISISSVTVSADNFNAAADIIRNSLGKDMEVINGDI